MTVFPRAILAYLKLEPRTTKIGKGVYTASGIEERSECQRTRVLSLARFRMDMTARQRVKYALALSRKRH